MHVSDHLALNILLTQRAFVLSPRVCDPELRAGLNKGSLMELVLFSPSSWGS